MLVRTIFITAAVAGHLKAKRYLGKNVENKDTNHLSQEISRPHTCPPCRHPVSLSRAPQRQGDLTAGPFLVFRDSPRLPPLPCFGLSYARRSG